MTAITPKPPEIPPYPSQMQAVKSVQRGYISDNRSTGENISAVNPSKSVLIFSYTSSGAADVDSGTYGSSSANNILVRGSINSSTSLIFNVQKPKLATRDGVTTGFIDYYLSWQVVEYV